MSSRRPYDGPILPLGSTPWAPSRRAYSGPVIPLDRQGGGVSVPEDVAKSTARGLANVPVGAAGLLDMASGLPYLSAPRDAYNALAGKEYGTPTDLAGATREFFGDAAAYESQTPWGTGAKWGAEGAASLAIPGGGGVALLRGSAKAAPLVAGTMGSTVAGNAGQMAGEKFFPESSWAAPALAVGAAMLGGGLSSAGTQSATQRNAVSAKVSDALDAGELPPSVRPGGPLMARLEAVGGTAPTRPGDPGVRTAAIVKARQRIAKGLLGREVSPEEFAAARASGDATLENALHHQQRLWDEAVRDLGESAARQAAGEVVAPTVGILSTGGHYGSSGYGVANLEKEVAEIPGLQQRIGSAYDQAKRSADDRLDNFRGRDVTDEAAARIDEELVSRLNAARGAYRTGEAYQNAPPIDGQALQSAIERAYGRLRVGEQLPLDPFELSTAARYMEKQGRWITLQDADDMAMDLKAAQRAAAGGASPDGKLAHAIGKIISEVEDAIDGSISKTVGMDDAPQLMQARAAFKKAIGELDPPKPGRSATREVKAAYAARVALQNKSGDGIVRGLLSPSAKARSEDVINRVKQILGEGSEEWELVRSATVRHLERNADIVDGSAGITRRLKELRREGNSEARAYKQILGDTEYGGILDAMQLKRAASYSSAGQAKQASQTGSGRTRAEGMAEGVTKGTTELARDTLRGILSFLPPSAADRLTGEALADPQIAHFLLSLTAEELERMVLREGGINAVRSAARSATVSRERK